MGVVIVHMVPCSGPEALQSTADNLCRMIERIGGQRDGVFCVDCETYFNTSMGRTQHVLHDSEHPASVFSLLESGLCLVADANFDSLMNKLTPQLFTTKMGTKVECKGPRYQVEDFVLKVGTVTIGTSARGLLVECEYQPCPVTASCWELMRELMESLLGVPLNQPGPYLALRMREIYTPVDTIQQYMEHFNVLRKSNPVQAVSAPASGQSGGQTNQNAQTPTSKG
ncbi:mediator of RNA polymerase II transcription subunit 20-like [Galendromus occidentalis]|uniref:Mediator of RNA polymerase II transcription subunit 20 n=1 Tax=Galendromus occidentalis TaxID=34638 RepID=A0AAJ6VV16_9ACAR|nr:mediator of RNA polymerase II transcription subunit 20-like [Galendromus occidentalis]